MTVLNYKNTHFNIIIYKNHALFQVGSLKFQQKKSTNPRRVLDTIVVQDARMKENFVTDVPEKRIDQDLEEHIHCHREEDTCLDKKHESEIVLMKKELDKHKLALKEELDGVGPVDNRPSTD